MNAIKKKASRGAATVFSLLLATLGTSPAQAHEHHSAGTEGHWMAPAQEARRHNPVKSTSASLARGEALFQTHCAACHGGRGEGDGPAAASLAPKPANLQEMSGHHSDGDLAWKIAKGRGAMPGWKDILSQKQIWDLVNHIRRLGGTPDR